MAEAISTNLTKYENIKCKIYTGNIESGRRVIERRGHIALCVACGTITTEMNDIC